MKWTRTACALGAILLCIPILLADGPPRVVNPAAGDMSQPPTTVAVLGHEPRGGGARGGGDTCDTATVIESLPFSDTGDTCSFADDYDEICPFDTPGAPDVVYVYTPASDVVVDISLCEDSAYDTKLYVYEDVCGTYQSGTAIACNDNGCSTPSFPQPFVSAVYGVEMTAGHTYYVVIDGRRSFHCGFYTLDMMVSEECPPNTMFGQGPSSPDDLFVFTVVDTDCSSDAEAWESFVGANGPICDIHWWGVKSFNGDFGFTPCFEDPMDFVIRFYENAGGVPGDVVCTYTASVSGRPTGVMFYGGGNTYEMYAFDLDLTPFGCCNLRHGWVSIVGGGDDPDCWFNWLSSGNMGVPGAEHLYHPDDGFYSFPSDLSLCLTGDFSLVGACCDELQGECLEDAQLGDCLGLQKRFVAGGTCADFDPPCGQAPGACCFPDATCAILLADECVAGGGDWLGADTTCDMCPCIVPCPPGGIVEDEPDCGIPVDTVNGGCNWDPPVFGTINCGDTICGTCAIDESVRDTDWYRLVITEDTEITVSIEAEFAVTVGLIENCGIDDCDAATPYLDPWDQAGECEPASVTAYLHPGVWWVFVTPQDFWGYVTFDCGPAYVLSLDCQPCEVERGACCLADGTCVPDTVECECLFATPHGLGGVEWHPGVGCDPNPCPQPSPGDNCSDPLPLTFTPGSTIIDSNTTCGRVNDYEYTCMVPFDLGQDIIYELTVTEDACLKITVEAEPGGEWAGVAVFAQCPADDPYSCIAMALSPDNPDVINDLELPAGVYYIMVDTYPPPDCTNFTMTIEDCPCGDLDGDGDVDVDDYYLFMGAFASCVGDLEYLEGADLDEDGCVTWGDYQIWVQCYRDANGRDWTGPPQPPEKNLAPRPGMLLRTAGGLSPRLIP